MPLVGLAPWTRQSGQWCGKSFIGGGRKSVRNMLFIAAMVATRHNPPLRQFRDKLIAAGKPKRVALIAVARKLLTILNAILRDKTPMAAQGRLTEKTVAHPDLLAARGEKEQKVPRERWMLRAD